MHEDPTRRMPSGPPPPRPGEEPQPSGYAPGRSGYGPGGEPPSGMSGGLKAILILLVAMVLGLGAALVLVSAGDDGEMETTAATGEPTTVTSTETATAPTTTPETTTATATAPTTTATETTTETTTETAGGTEAP